MSTIDHTFQGLDLTKTEIAIYLAGLRHSSIGVALLAKETQLKRPTIYHAIGTLMAKGLVTKKGSGSRLVFMMTKPELLPRLLEEKISVLQRKKSELESIIPMLAETYRQESEDSTVLVSHFEGIEGIKLLMEEAYYCASKHWDILSPRNNFFLEFDPAYAAYYLDMRKKRGIKARTLWERAGELSKRKLVKEEVAWRNPRYLPESMNDQFSSLILLFDGKVAFISSLRELSGILIRSCDVYRTVSAMFETIWNVSEPYDEFQKKRKIGKP